MRQNILGIRNRVSKEGKVQSVGPGWEMAQSLVGPQCQGLAGQQRNENHLKCLI